MATKFFIVENSEGEQRLIEAKSQKAVERFLVKEILENYSITRASALELISLVGKGVTVELAFEPEDPANVA